MRMKVSRCLAFYERKTVGMTHRETYLSRELFLELCLIISQSSRHDHVFPKSQNWKQHLDVFQMAAQYPVIIYWSKTIKWWNKIKWNSFCSLNLPSKIKNRDTKEKEKNMQGLAHAQNRSSTLCPLVLGSDWKLKMNNFKLSLLLAPGLNVRWCVCPA